MITTVAIFCTAELWLNLCLPFLDRHFLKYGNLAPVPPPLPTLLPNHYEGMFRQDYKVERSLVHYYYKTGKKPYNTGEYVTPKRYPNWKTWD